MKARDLASLLSGIILFSCLMQSCVGAGTEKQPEGKVVEMKYARNIKIEEFDGYSKVTIRNPWDTVKILQTLLLVNEGTELPVVNGGEDVVAVPLRKSVVFSTVHNSFIGDIGKADAVSGICDIDYIKDKVILDRVKYGKLVDCGNSMNPNMERIVSLAPDAALISPYESGGMEGKLRKVGIPVVECADYMETTPLGRAEWIKFFCRLYGKQEMGDSLFRDTEKKYLNLLEKGKGSATKPKILFDRLYGGIWSVPGKNSTIGKLVEDAGGVNPFGGDDRAGSLNLSGEQVLYDGGDADIWLIRYAGPALTKGALLKEKPLYGEFEAFKKGNVYVSETTTSGIFEDFAFHPDLLLGNLIVLFHPELNLKCEKEYFHKLPD